MFNLLHQTPVRIFWLALFLIGCQSVGSRIDTNVAESKQGRKVSVNPGINEPYQDIDLDEWVERFEGESREIFRERHRIVEAVGIEPRMVVADIGAGTGLFVPLFAEAVGPSGKVLAVDIVPEFIELIRRRAKEKGLTNVQTVLCDEDSVRLPAGSIDVAFVCDTYHHFEYPQDTLRSIHRALRDGAQLIIIEFERIPGKSREWVLDHVRAGKDVFTQEIRSAGFELVEEVDAPYLAENYVLRFRKVP